MLEMDAPCASLDVPSWGHSRTRPGKDMLRLEIGSPSPRLLEQSKRTRDRMREVHSLFAKIVLPCDTVADR